MFAVDAAGRVACGLRMQHHPIHQTAVVGRFSVSEWGWRCAGNPLRLQIGVPIAAYGLGRRAPPPPPPAPYKCDDEDALCGFFESLSLAVTRSVRNTAYFFIQGCCCSPCRAVCVRKADLCMGLPQADPCMGLPQADLCRAHILSATIPGSVIGCVPWQAHVLGRPGIK